MFKILSISLALVIAAILIIVLSGNKSKKPYDLSGFMKWAGDIHAGESTSGYLPILHYISKV